jgi:PTS system nitrogen regulatory IIA component
MRITDFLKREGIIDITSSTKEGVIEELSRLVAVLHPDVNEEVVVSSLLEREKLGSTGIEHGVAIPHARVKGLDNIVVVFGRSAAGVDFEAHDGSKSHLFFVILAPEKVAGLHVKLLGRVSQLLSDPNTRDAIMKAKDLDEVYQVIKERDEALC